MAESSTEQDPALEDVRDAFEYDTEQWRPIREEGKTDIKYVAGDPWSDKDRKAREEAGRPFLSLDELGQYTNQLINEVRQHKRAIQVSPLGNGANDATARVRADLIRQIEYRSNAQIAYTTGFENTVQRSYGFWRVKPRFESPRSFHQELYIEPFVNPDMVTPDSDLQQPDGSDMKRAFVHERWRIKDFKKRWPKAQVSSFTSLSDFQRDAPRWIDDKTIQIAEYWSIEDKTRQLLLVQGPQGPTAVFFDELQPPKDAKPESLQTWEVKFRPLVGQAVMQNREVQYPQVRMRLTNGFEFLPDEEGRTVTDWPGRYIPIVCCFGKVLYVNDGGGSKRRIMSLVRLARDPYMLYCYSRTTQAELAGGLPKFPYFAYEGQLSDIQEQALAKSVHEPVAVIKVKPLLEDVPMGTGPLPFPQRQPYDAAGVTQLEIVAEAARRAIQSAMGMSPLPTSAQRRNEKSGVALKQIEDSTQKGSLHFIDHYEMAITRTGVLLDDLLDHYYDAARDVTLRTAAGDTRVQRINDPAVPDDKSQQPIMMGQGTFDITLSTGPSYDSERELANEFTDSIVGNLQAIAPLIGPQASAKLLALSIKLKNVGPLGDEMMEIISPSQQGTPEQLAAQLQEAQQIIQAMQAELAQAKQDLETDAIKAQRDVQLAEVKANTDAQTKVLEMMNERLLKLQELEVQLELGLAKLGSAEAMARGQIEMQQLHHHDEMALRDEELSIQTAQQTIDRETAKDEAEKDRVAKAATSDVSSGATS